MVTFCVLPSCCCRATQALVYSPLIGAEMVAGDNAEGFIDGKETDYRTSAIDRADCHFCRFKREVVEEEDEEETGRDVE